MGVGLRGKDLGFRGCVLEFRNDGGGGYGGEDLGLGCRDSGFVRRVRCSGFGVRSSGFQFSGSGYRGSGVRIPGSGFRSLGFGSRV